MNGKNDNYRLLRFHDPELVPAPHLAEQGSQLLKMPVSGGLARTRLLMSQELIQQVERLAG